MYDDDDFDDDDPAAWYACPLCGAEVYESADICPECDQFMVPKLRTQSDSRPIWYVTLGLAGILAVIVVLSGFLAWLV